MWLPRSKLISATGVLPSAVISKVTTPREAATNNEEYPMSDEPNLAYEYRENAFIKGFTVERIDDDWYGAEMEFTKQGFLALVAYLARLGVPPADVAQALADVRIPRYDPRP